MKKILIATWCVAGSLAFASCGDSDNTNTDTETGTATVAGDSTLTEDTRELMAFAARNMMLQVQLGQLATQQGATDNVKSFGQDLVEWYGTKQTELQELATQYNVMLPQQLEDDEREHLEEVQEADSGEFDEEYWESVIKAQKEAIDEFDDELKKVDQATANSFTIWARTTLDELRAQLTQAEAYQLELNNREGGITESI